MQSWGRAQLVPTPAADSGRCGAKRPFQGGRVRSCEHRCPAALSRTSRLRRNPKRRPSAAKPRAFYGVRCDAVGALVIEHTFVYDQDTNAVARSQRVVLHTLLDAHLSGASDARSGRQAAVARPGAMSGHRRCLQYRRARLMRFPVSPTREASPTASALAQCLQRSSRAPDHPQIWGTRGGHNCQPGAQPATAQSQMGRLRRWDTRNAFRLSLSLRKC